MTVRGLRQISGEAEFNEVFFDDLVLDPDAVVGGRSTAAGASALTDADVRAADDRRPGPRASVTTAAASPRRWRRDQSASADAEVRHGLGDSARSSSAIRLTSFRPISALSARPDSRAGVRPREGHDGQRAIKAGDLIADVLGPEALDPESEWSLHDLVPAGLKSAGGTEEILRNTIGERVLGLPPSRGWTRASRSASCARRRRRRRPHELRALRRAGLPARGGAGALSRAKTIEAAREALEDDQASLPDLWPTAVEAGWPGLLIGEEHGGAALGAFDAMLVAEECGRVLAGVRCSECCRPR